MNTKNKIVEQWQSTGGFEPKPSSSNTGGSGFQPKPATGSGGFEPKPGSGGGFQPKPGTGSGTGGFQPKPGAGGTSGAGTGGTTADPFACLLAGDSDIKKVANTKYAIDNSYTGKTYLYWEDGDFSIKKKNDLGGKSDFTGKWKCTSDSSFVIDTSDGDHYDSKTQKWSGSSSSSSSSSSGGGSSSTLVNTSLTIDDVKAGKEVSKGMKGAVVGEIQKLLIAAGFKNISKSGNVDNIFGSRTKSSVEDFQKANKDADGNQLTVDGIVGDKTINALQKATPASSSSSSSSSSEDPNRKPFDPNAEEDNSIPSTDGTLIKEKKKMLQESLKKMLRNSLLKYS